MAIPSQYMTVDDLVASVYRASALPNSQNTFTTADIAAFLDEEQRLTICNLIHKVREEYWVTYFDTQIQNSVYEYTMPQRGVSGALRDIVFVDPSGNEIEIAHLAPEQIKTPAYYAYRPAFQQQGFFIKDGKVVLWPQNYSNTAYILRQKLERRPNALTLEVNCAEVTATDTVLNTITVSSVPADWIVGTTVDVIDNNPQFTSKADGMVITSITNLVLGFASVSSNISAHMWVCPTGTTCVPQIPFEGYALLIQLGVLRVHQAMQNSNGFSTTAKLVEGKTTEFLETLTPRIEGQPQKIVNKSALWLPFGYPFFR